jgi:hypothetical protein
MLKPMRYYGARPVVTPRSERNLSSPSMRGPMLEEPVEIVSDRLLSSLLGYLEGMKEGQDMPVYEPIEGAEPDPEIISIFEQAAVLPPAEAEADSPTA